MFEFNCYLLLLWLFFLYNILMLEIIKLFVFVNRKEVLVLVLNELFSLLCLVDIVFSIRLLLLNVGFCFGLIGCVVYCLLVFRGNNIGFVFCLLFRLNRKVL